MKKKNRNLVIPDATEGFVPTLNCMGFMTHYLDPFSQALIDFTPNAPGPFLDIGTAYGITCKKALEKKVHVIANDLDERHLTILLQGLTEEERSRIQISVGKFPDEIDFPDNSLGAVLACRVLHFYYGQTIERGIAKIIRWLSKGGKLCVVTETPYLGNFKKFHSVYEERKKQGIKWPGWIDNVSEYEDAGFGKNLPQQIHFLDRDILERIFIEAGLMVEKIGYINQIHFPAPIRYDGRESVSIMGVKV